MKFDKHRKTSNGNDFSRMELTKRKNKSISTIMDKNFGDNPNRSDDSSLKRFEWKKACSIVTCTLLCFVNMAFLEQILRLAPKSANFISFVQHIFITLCGLMTVGLPFGLGSHQSQVPTKFYLPLVFLNFFSILTNNLSHQYGVSIPLNMIFKSSSLVANMLLGMIFLRHRYSLNKFISVMFITFGLILCTIEDYRVKHSLEYSEIISSFLYAPVFQNRTIQLEPDNDPWKTTIGILLVTCSFLLGAGIGIYQEYLSKNFAKNSSESLYYVHLLSLPIFLLSSSVDIKQNLHLFLNIIGDLGNYELLSSTTNSDHQISFLWLYLVLTVLTQYLCIRSVYRLTTECSSLIVTLCVTNRKFLSLMFSIFYFGNTFTIWHWNGSLIVFGGTISFYLIDAIKKSPQTTRKKD